MLVNPAISQSFAQLLNSQLAAYDQVTFMPREVVPVTYAHTIQGPQPVVPSMVSISIPDAQPAWFLGFQFLCN